VGKEKKAGGNSSYLKTREKCWSNRSHLLRVGHKNGVKRPKVPLSLKHCYETDSRKWLGERGKEMESMRMRGTGLEDESGKQKCFKYEGRY